MIDVDQHLDALMLASSRAINDGERPLRWVVPLIPFLLCVLLYRAIHPKHRRYRKYLATCKHIHLLDYLEQREFIDELAVVENISYGDNLAYLQFNSDTDEMLFTIGYRKKYSGLKGFAS